jgi:hypothetical protein
VRISIGSFRMAGGTVYGNDVAPPNANTASTGAALSNNGGTATWGLDGTGNNFTNYINNTIRVVGGVMQ